MKVYSVFTLARRGHIIGLVEKAFELGEHCAIQTGDILRRVGDGRMWTVTGCGMGARRSGEYLIPLGADPPNIGDEIERLTN